MERIDLYDKPIEILNEFENRGYAGMSDFELSFLCGALKKFKPKKIVEVGVAAGGTTSVILNCMKLLNYEFEMYSVDICEQCYLDVAKKTGFIAQELLKEKSIKNVLHQFMLGNTIAKKVEEIGKGIDFVILDTMHSLPGELLDFIALYPYLDAGAVIIFHDVGQSQLGIGHISGAPYEYASLVTLSTMVGDKYLPVDEGRLGGFSNIGAMKLNKYSQYSLENLFLGLFINWNYIPDKRSLDEYREVIAKKYDEKYYKMFEQAIECNVFSLYRRNQLMVSIGKIKSELDKIIMVHEKVYIYGAGAIGNAIREYVENLLDGKRIGGFIVTEKKEQQRNNIFELKEINETDNMVIILGLNEKYHLEVIGDLHKEGLSKYLFPYNGIGFREMLEIIKFENTLNKKEEEYKNSYGYESWIRKVSLEGK